MHSINEYPQDAYSKELKEIVSSLFTFRSKELKKHIDRLFVNSHYTVNNEKWALFYSDNSIIVTDAEITTTKRKGFLDFRFFHIRSFGEFHKWFTDVVENDNCNSDDRQMYIVPLKDLKGIDYLKDATGIKYWAFMFVYREIAGFCRVCGAVSLSSNEDVENIINKVELKAFLNILANAVEKELLANKNKPPQNTITMQFNNLNNYGQINEFNAANAIANFTSNGVVVSEEARELLAVVEKSNMPDAEKKELAEAILKHKEEQDGSKKRNYRDKLIGFFKKNEKLIATMLKVSFAGALMSVGLDVNDLIE